MNEQEAKKVISKIRQQIAEYFKKYKLKYAIFGKSEGIDSSVIAGLLSGIESIRPIGVILPIESKPETEKIAKIVLEHFKIPYIQVDLTNEYRIFKNAFYKKNSLNDQLKKILIENQDKRAVSRVGEREKYALGNIKARLRMITLYHIAQLTGGIVISTDNYSEYWMGFWTLNGDVGDLAPIQQIFKGLELYTIAKVLGVPKESIEAVPTDGLEVIPGGTDQDQLLLPYPELDKVIISLLKENFENEKIEKQLNIVRRVASKVGNREEEVSHVAGIMKSTYYKRHWPKIIKREELGLKSVEEIYGKTD